jgi:hypothetical protein
LFEEFAEALAQLPQFEAKKRHKSLYINKATS